MTVTNKPTIDAYPSFVEGELVVLKSGGPDMTILGYCDDCDEVDVAYADSDGDIEILTLPSACASRVH